MSEKYPFDNKEPEASYENGEGRRFLHELESRGLYVFHGSPNPHIDEFELRQPTHWEGDCEILDGELCVAATRFADFAIFRALTQNKTGSSSFGTRDDGSMYCRFDKQLKEALADAVGSVYVFPKDQFAPWSRDVGVIEGGDEDTSEWRAHEPRKAIKVVHVNASDLPSMELMDE